MNDSNSGERPCPSGSGNRLASPSQNEQWMWHELPSRSLNFAMNDSAAPRCQAISLAAFL